MMKGVNQDQPHSQSIKTTSKWSAEPLGGKIHHDSVSRFREIIILITSLVPVGEKKRHKLLKKIKLRSAACKRKKE